MSLLSFLRVPKFVGVIILAVVVAYAIFWETPTSKWARALSTADQRIAAGEDVDLAELRRGPAHVRWWKDRAKLNDTFNTSFLSDARMVSVSLAVPLPALLAAGEPLPEDVLKDIYVAGRAPAYLNELCTEVLNTIAVKCDLARPQGEIGRDGLAQLEGFLRFVPRDDPGTLPQTDSAEYITLRFLLNKGKTVPFTPEAREDALGSAGLLCRALRAQVGNCVVTRVALAPQRKARAAGTMILDAQVALTVYADPADIDVDALSDKLVQVWRFVGL